MSAGWPGSARLRAAVAAACILALAGAAGACGKKSDLEPPPSAKADQPERDEDR